MFRKIYKFLASLTFAVSLLVGLILGAGVGTWLETQYSADLAQKWIYNNWLFNIWLTALCVNLFCVASIRYPWKKHQTGFVITHAGIITLLVGSMIDRIWGIEGFIHLHSNKPGTSIMELHEQVARVIVDGKTAETNFKVSTLGPQALKSPDASVKVEVRDMQPVSASEVAVAAPEGTKKAKPGVNFTLQGAMMGRNDLSIFFNEVDDLMGMASVAFVPGAPPEGDEIESSFVLDLDFKGKNFQFPVKQGESKTYALDGLPGWKVRIKDYFPNMRMNGPIPANLNDKPENPAAVFELIGPEVPGMTNGRAPEEDPHSQGAQQQDPGMAPQTERFFVFYKGGHVMNAPLHGEATDAQPRLTPNIPLQMPNGIAFYLGADGKLRYLLKSRVKQRDPDEDPRSTYTSGEIEMEKPIPVSWAPGAECVVHELVMSAKRKVVFNPRPELKKTEDANFGLKCRVTVGSDIKEMWIGQTEVGRAFPQEMEVGGKKINFEFVNRTVTLPYTISLKKFNAPTDEGSTEFSAFESILSFAGQQDTLWLKSDSPLAKARGNAVLTGAILDETADGIKFLNGFGNEGWIERKDIDRVEKLTHKISMNRPTTFPVSFLGPFLGLNYKFSQANHRIIPGDPKKSDYTYSGVQVLRDPGWFFKWFGCIMIVFGIYTMFYLRPYFNRKPEPAAVPVATKGKNKGAAVLPQPVALRFWEHPLVVLSLIFVLWPVGIHLLIASRAFKPNVKIGIIFVTLAGLLLALTRLY